ncbi:MAG: helicase-related protein, partial [Candidatus Micrarchaeia archaeon]
YIFKNISEDKEFKNLKIEKICGCVPARERELLVTRFKEKKIDIIFSTDVLSEGQNLQTAQYCINYDMHWNPTRMIQRAGRIDRIGSPFQKIFIYNFFPEDELEELLELVKKLQKKIIDIDESIGLDQSVLGELIHPKVFGIINKIKNREESVFDELEEGMFGGGERFYQPLKEYLKKIGLAELEKLPFGIYSGLRKQRGSAIFFYYQYDKKYHYWLLLDPQTGQVITENKTQILDFISCKEREARIIPDFLSAVYECNKQAVKHIESVYKKLEVQNVQERAISHLFKQPSSKFLQKMLQLIDYEIDEHLSEYPADKQIEVRWETLKQKLLSLPLTKKRLSILRKIWKNLKQGKQWKEAINELERFASGKQEIPVKEIEVFDPKKLRLVVVDLIS